MRLIFITYYIVNDFINQQVNLNQKNIGTCKPLSVVIAFDSFIYPSDTKRIF